ncbi:MAG: hypothetical protein Q9223_002364 [Gallowayella weberi]
MTRVTRGSAAKEAAFAASSEKENLSQLSSPSLTTPPGEQKRAASKSKPAARKATDTKATSTKTQRTGKGPATAKEEDAPVTPAATTNKRKRSAALKTKEEMDELPHGLGKLRKSDPATTEAKESLKFKPTEGEIDGKSITKQSRVTPVVKPAIEAATAAATDAPDNSPTNKAQKKKANPYGLTPGVSPFPGWPHPTAEECQQVNDLLSALHGTVKAPEKIPEPSATIAGCGKVPSVLDALIRTLLSAATSGTNSSRAFQGLVEEYGTKKTGLGKGSVDWDAVRRSDVSRVFNAIKSGGLADVKSKKIKLILDMVYEENQARRKAFVEAREENDAGKAAAIAPKGAKYESDEAKAVEIKGADEDVLSLDYLHSMPSQDSFNHMLRYPGIGVKTASCVTMFCLRRPSFAVDTHVFRLCQWLGWVPEKANRDTTFMHCEVMVPDELKYSLHQLLIQHGKKCGRCRAITGESSEGWGAGCVIDHLVKRTGLRKGGQSPVTQKKAKRMKKVEESDEDEDEEIDNRDESDFEAPSKKKVKVVTQKKAPSKARKGAQIDDDKEKDVKASVKKRGKKSTAAAPEKPANKVKEETKPANTRVETEKSKTPARKRKTTYSEA